MMALAFVLTFALGWMSHPIAPQAAVESPLILEVQVTTPCVVDRPARPIYTSDEALIGLAVSCTSDADTDCGKFVRDIHRDRVTAIRYGDDLDAATAGCR